MFGWGTSGYNHGAVCYQPWSTSQINVDYFAYGSVEYNLFDQDGRADWGFNTISNGGNSADQWRTLTKDEWVYLLLIRNTMSGMRYAKARVNGTKGVLLFPDGWDSSIYTINYANVYSVSFNCNVIDVETFQNILESNGVVFLPAAGSRLGINAGDGNANIIDFDDDHLSYNKVGNRCRGYSVRLVTENY